MRAVGMRTGARMNEARCERMVVWFCALSNVHACRADVQLHRDIDTAMNSMQIDDTQKKDDKPNIFG
jgi:hypothetical protein